MRQFVLNTGILVLLIGLSGLMYIRIAPLDTVALHVAPPKGAATPDAPRIAVHGALFNQTMGLAPQAALEALNSVVLATPHTTVLAGSIEADMITYITRSRIFGFPDATTVQVLPEGEGSRLVIYGRLIYGRSDFGVNEARIRRWLKLL